MNLEELWEQIADELYMDMTCSDTEGLRHLIFDTYHFLEEKLTGKEDFPREFLKTYKHIVRACSFFSMQYLSDVPKSVSATFGDCLHGLCYVIEHGFDTGYYKHSLPMGLVRHTPAGCSEPETDMSSYASFTQSFDDNVTMLREDYDME